LYLLKAHRIELLVCNATKNLYVFFQCTMLCAMECKNTCYLRCTTEWFSYCVCTVIKMLLQYISFNTQISLVVECNAMERTFVMFSLHRVIIQIFFAMQCNSTHLISSKHNAMSLFWYGMHCNKCIAYMLLFNEHCQIVQQHSVQQHSCYLFNAQS
jgi:hypothetical protein